MSKRLKISLTQGKDWWIFLSAGTVLYRTVAFSSTKNQFRNCMVSSYGTYVCMYVLKVSNDKRYFYESLQYYTGMVLYGSFSFSFSLVLCDCFSYHSRIARKLGNNIETWHVSKIEEGWGPVEGSSHLPFIHSYKALTNTFHRYGQILCTYVCINICILVSK